MNGDRDSNGSWWIAGILLGCWLLTVFCMMSYRDGFLEMKAENDKLAQQIKLLQEDRDSWNCNYNRKKKVTFCIKKSDKF